MDDTTEVMRQQIVDTRSQLTEKLVSLEQQVSDTVQSTGSAVNATVGAVQETVESVTNAVKGAVQSISDAIDIRQQMKQHPWLILGGSVALGYLAVDLLEQSTRASGIPKTSATRPIQSESPRGSVVPQSTAGFAATPRAIAAANEAASTNFLWHQLTTAITGALVGIVQDAATHVVPQIMEYLNRSNTEAESEATEVLAGANRQRSTLSTPGRLEACRTNGR